MWPAVAGIQRRRPRHQVREPRTTTDRAPDGNLAAMCNHLAILHAAPNIVHACRTSGVTLPPSTPPPSAYAAGKTCKHAKDKDGKLGGTTFPVLHLSGGELTVETMEWGVRQLSTHNIWCDDDKWVETKTWRACIASGRRCAVCVNAFAEGITCRQPSDGLFFLAALHLNGAFIILTTDSTRVPLLAERAASQAEHGVPTRCPLWMDAAEATHWLTDEAAATPAGAIAAVRRLEAAVRANKPELVQGSSAAPRARSEALKPDAQQGSLTSFLRKSAGAPSPAPAPAPKRTAEQQAEAALPTPVLTTDSTEGHSAERAAPRACPACTLETEDVAQAKCEACGCELDPPTSAKRRKPSSPHKKRSIQSFFAKKPSPAGV